MRRFVCLTALVAVLGAMVAPAPAGADRSLPPTESFEHTRNVQPLGFSPFPNTASPFTANSELAFWGRHAFQGHYDGFRILDVSSPARPRQAFFQECLGNQGDVVV